MSNTFLELPKWILVQSLGNLEWRIPTNWTSVYQQAKQTLHHPYKAIREQIAKYKSAILFESVDQRVDLP
jgi:hypothetical protein